MLQYSVHFLAFNSYNFISLFFYVIFQQQESESTQEILFVEKKSIISPINIFLPLIMVKDILKITLDTIVPSTVFVGLFL